MIERDKAKYFHGRKEELKQFKFLLDLSKKRGIGSSFLIQGAPGVGKSALIHECEEIARKLKWNVVKLGIRSLSNETDLFNHITKNTNPKEIIKSQGVNFQVWKASIQTKSREEIDYVNEDLVKSRPTLFVLDEAQNLGIKDTFSNEDKKQIVDFLDRHHNLKTNNGFVMFFGGLSHTRKVLVEFGLSRINEECCFNLQPLDNSSERAIIRDWITEKVKYKGYKSEIEHWIDQITTRTSRWPRHIASYCNQIDVHLQKNEVLTDGQLKMILERGDVLKAKYYNQRCEKLLRTDRKILAKLVQHLPSIFDKIDVIEFLKKEKDLLTMTKEEFWDASVAKGVFHLRVDGAFSIPIPSFKTWLFEQYGNS
ncbi:MAG: ATP-binding protein [Flavobacteriaceae bacterium]|nr:ATP-binding protein [Flavobacteriaceae bacterium]